MISKIGCQPYWLNYIDTDVANCSKASQLDMFLKDMQILTMMTREKKIIDEYKCLKPCNYMEYKVYQKLINFSFTKTCMTFLGSSVTTYMLAGKFPPDNKTDRHTHTWKDIRTCRAASLHLTLKIDVFV